MIDLQQWFVLLEQEPKQRPAGDGITDDTAAIQAWIDYRYYRNHPMWVIIWPVPTYVLHYKA